MPGKSSLACSGGFHPFRMIRKEPSFECPRASDQLQVEKRFLTTSSRDGATRLMLKSKQGVPKLAIQLRWGARFEDAELAEGNLQSVSNLSSK